VGSFVAFIEEGQAAVPMLGFGEALVNGRPHGEAASWRQNPTDD
jgi:hypothetical protein